MMLFLWVLLSTLLGQALLNVAVVIFHAESSWVLLPPILLVVVVFCFDLLLGLWVLICAGILMDSLTGSLAGTHMLMLTFLGLCGMGLSSWLWKAHWPMVVVFLLGTSLVYRIGLLQISNWSLVNL